MAAASSAEEANERNTPGHGYSNKRQRTEEGHRSSYRAVDFEDDEDDQGCFCANTGCPWHWDSNGSSSSGSRNSRSSSSGGSGGEELGSSGSMALPGVNEPSFFHGPLLSVKEYRDRPSGEVRFAVFQGDRQSNRYMSVAQILFTLKHRGDRAYGHVKSVKVNRDFRGMGLGPLLFKEVFATLGNLSVQEVRLEAEEDMCKYNRLVKYYENLGFRQLEGSKVHYIHHLDQVFRKIPMCRQLPLAHPRSRRSPRLVDNGSFLVVRLQTKTGAFVRSTANGNVLSPASAGAPGGVAAVSTAATAATAAAAFCSSSSSAAAHAATASEARGNPGGGGAAARCGGGGGGGAAGAAGGGEGAGESQEGVGGGGAGARVEGGRMSASRMRTTGGY